MWLARVVIEIAAPMGRKEIERRRHQWLSKQTDVVNVEQGRKEWQEKSGAGVGGMRARMN